MFLSCKSYRYWYQGFLNQDFSVVLIHSLTYIVFQGDAQLEIIFSERVSFQMIINHFEVM